MDTDDFLFFDDVLTTTERPLKIEEFRFSASSLKDYGTCPYKFKLSRVINAEPTHDDRTYVWVGTLVHTSIYYAIADPTESGWAVSGIKPIQEVRRLFELLTDQSAYDVDIVQKLIKSGTITDTIPDLYRPVNDKEVAKMDISNQEKWYELAWRLIKNGYDVITSVYSAPDTKGIQLEVPLNFKAFDVNFVGYIDILVEDVDGRLKFFDLKTSKRPITNPSTDIQFFLYRLGLNIVYGLDYFPTGYYVHLRSSSLYAADKPMNEVGKQVTQVIKFYLEEIRKGNFPRNIGSPLCNYCSFRGYCYSGESTPSLLDVLESNMKLPEVVDTTIPVFDEK